MNYAMRPAKIIVCGLEEITIKNGKKESYTFIESMRPTMRITIPYLEYIDFFENSSLDCPIVDYKIC